MEMTSCGKRAREKRGSKDVCVCASRDKAGCVCMYLRIKREGGHLLGEFLAGFFELDDNLTATSRLV